MPNTQVSPDLFVQKVKITLVANLHPPQAMGQYNKSIYQNTRAKVNTLWQLPNHQFELHRFPKGMHDKSLQAWDSADEYLVQYIEDVAAENKQNLAIVNDNFGALAVAFSDYQPTSYSDSKVAQLATAQNCAINDVALPRWGDILEPWQETPLVVLKLTKSIGYLEFQLAKISQLKTPCNIVAAGKTTQVTSNILKLFEKYFSDVTTSLAKKKSRLIFANHDGQSHKNLAKYPTQISWSELNITLHSHANVFAGEQLDIGGRFLAENLPNIQNDQVVVDLGCGNGLLSIACLKQIESTNVQAELILSDESYMAIESAKMNVESNFPALVDMCHFKQEDCMAEQPHNSVDIVLCNPPFHQQNTITEHIAKQMFQQAADCLVQGGQLYVVANRHLPYQAELKKRFGGFKVVAQNKKFIIFQCNKK